MQPPCTFPPVSDMLTAARAHECGLAQLQRAQHTEEVVQASPAAGPFGPSSKLEVAGDQVQVRKNKERASRVSDQSMVCVRRGKRHGLGCAC